jgi:hypothetical protein
VELREQPLVQERGLDEWEDALLAREHGIVEATRALGGHAWSATSFLTRPRPSRRTIRLGCTLLPPVGGIL